MGVVLTTRQRRTADEREEWGRRFVAAILHLSASDYRSQRLGRTLVEQLLRSKLASEDDRRIAERLMAEDALEPTADDTHALAALFAAFDSGRNSIGSLTLDDIEIVEDDELDRGDGRAGEDGQGD